MTPEPRRLTSRDARQVPEAIQLTAADGYALRGWLWRDNCSSPPKPVVIVNGATSVRCRYYHVFATELYQHGCNVLTYDYRGIGESRLGSVRHLTACWLDWGEYDFEGVLQYAVATFPGQPIHVVGHSVGGFLIGLAASSHLIGRIFTMGAQFAYWHDYARESRARMYLRWHLAMPTLARMFGYVPAKRLGWMEDTPKGVALDWAHMGPRFEISLAYRHQSRVAQPAVLTRGFGQVRAPILALGIDDDPFGTPPAIERLLGYFTQSERHHIRRAPAGIGQAEIGHFAFFQRQFRESLWPIATNWLLYGRVPPTEGDVPELRVDSTHPS